MKYPKSLPKVAVAAVLTFPGALAALSGCGDDSNSADARIAEKAVGVEPRSETQKSVNATRDVTVVKDTKVIDNKTGQVISETKQETPVKIVEQKQVKTDVKVDVGQTSGNAGNPKGK